MKRKKRSNLQKARDEADAKFQEIGLKLNPLCEICGKKATVVHHFIAKSLSNKLRHEIKNGVSLCFSHHQKIHSVADPEIRDVIEAKRGKKWYNELKKLRREPVRVNLQFYKENLQKLCQIQPKKEQSPPF